MNEIDVDVLAEKVGAILADRLAPASLVPKTVAAVQLGVAPATIDRLVKEGMPEEHIGDAPRYDVSMCRRWCAERWKRKRESSQDVGDDKDDDVRLARRKGR